MIFGDYPCCDGPLTLSVGDLDTPVIQREICPHCGALVWHKLSRWDPESWTDAAFRELYDVDDETKAVKPKTEPVSLPPEIQAIFDRATEATIAVTVKEIEDEFLYGTRT